MKSQVFSLLIITLMAANAVANGNSQSRELPAKKDQKIVWDECYTRYFDTIGSLDFTKQAAVHDQAKKDLHDCWRSKGMIQEIPLEKAAQIPDSSPGST